MNMVIRVYRNPSKAEGYICSKKDIKGVFDGIENLRVGFGLSPKYEFDSLCYHHPKINGVIVMDASISRNLEPSLYLFSIAMNLLTQEIRSQFMEKIVFQLKAWFNEQLAKRETEILGYESLLVELYRENFTQHRLRFR